MKILPLLSGIACIFAGFSAHAQQLIYAPPPAQQVIVAAPPPQPYCREYTDKVTIAGESRITHGTACLQPDGSWALQPSQAPVNYVMRGNAIYLVPMRPFATVIIDDHHHHHDHYYAH